MGRNAQIANGTVFWQHWTGKLMVAPDSRMNPLKGWNRIECKTTSEVESYSRQMARQEYQKFKSLKVEEHLRGQKRREELKANCRLRLAKGCISAEDERLTRETLRSLERKDDLLYQIIREEPDYACAHLLVEETEESTSPSAILNKKRGLQDEDINFIGKLSESVVMA